MEETAQLMDGPIRQSFMDASDCVVTGYQNVARGSGAQESVNVCGIILGTKL